MSWVTTNQGFSEVFTPDGAPRPHYSALVGSLDAFTRADLTLAALLTPVLGLPPDDLFAIDPGLRPMFGIALGDDPALAPLRTWRDETYRRHRGRRVTPPGV